MRQFYSLSQRKEFTLKIILLTLSSAVNVVAKCLTKLFLFTESEISRDTAFFLFISTQWISDNLSSV